MRIQEIEAKAASFLSAVAGNRLPGTEIPIFDAPLFATAAANDPLFDRLKEPEVVGPAHLSPREWLPDAASVVCWFLPFSGAVRSSNRLDAEKPSAFWLQGRIEGEMVNDELRRFVVSVLSESGAKALVPCFDSRYAVVNRLSDWSERHAAFIAGLGTFGLSKSLITRKGSAGRFGSVVTDVRLKPTVRPYTGLYEYCSRCLECASRCPADAIDAAGKRHGPCEEYVDAIKIEFAPRYGCGKCQTAVSCESGIPTAG